MALTLTNDDVNLIWNKVIGSDANGTVTAAQALGRANWLYNAFLESGQFNSQLDQITADVDDIQARI
ncbi:MAG TPA: hypothetical protein VFB74_30670 [Kribbellaceae bacterium]|nr:hypothetical protein [Kribbellaceae bacterium]